MITEKEWERINEIVDVLIDKNGPDATFLVNLLERLNKKQQD